MQKSNQMSNTTVDEIRFFELCDLLRKLLLSQNIFSPSADDKAKSYFKALESNQKKAILINFEKYLEICKNYQDYCGTEKWSEKIFLWNCIKLCKWKLPDEVMERIQPEDVIEILDQEGKQVFRSLNFFSLTSYELETFLSLPWNELFAREAYDHDVYFDFFIKCLTATDDVVYPLDFLPPHSVKETQSQGRLQGENQPMFCAPVFDIKTLQSVAVIHVFRPSNLRKQEIRQPFLSLV